MASNPFHLVRCLCKIFLLIFPFALANGKVQVGDCQGFCKAYVPGGGEISCSDGRIKDFDRRFCGCEKCPHMCRDRRFTCPDYDAQERNKPKEPEKSFLQKYGWYILAGVVGTIIQIGCIGGCVYTRKRRTRLHGGGGCHRRSLFCGGGLLCCGILDGGRVGGGVVGGGVVSGDNGGVGISTDGVSDDGVGINTNTLSSTMDSGTIDKTETS